MKPTDANLVPQGVVQADVMAWRDSTAANRQDWVADEVPVALVFNGITQAVMLASPSDLEDFALGFALTEGLIESSKELYGTEVNASSHGIEVELEVASACEWRLRERRRFMAGRTGCGLCGVDSLGQVRRALSRVETASVALAALGIAQRELRTYQAAQQLTGATHAASWSDWLGNAHLVREDVGRHNALDKLIGAMVRKNTDPTTGFISITSRASFEMVQKTAAAGVGILSAVSAPTALAVRTAQELGIALAGFVRGEDCVLYTYPEQFILPHHGH